jgi:hypothetical protein
MVLPRGSIASTNAGASISAVIDASHGDQVIEFSQSGDVMLADFDSVEGGQYIE